MLRSFNSSDFVAADDDFSDFVSHKKASFSSGSDDFGDFVSHEAEEPVQVISQKGQPSHLSMKISKPEERENVQKILETCSLYFGKALNIFDSIRSKVTDEKERVYLLRGEPKISKFFSSVVDLSCCLSYVKGTVVMSQDPDLLRILERCEQQVSQVKSQFERASIPFPIDNNTNNSTILDPGKCCYYCKSCISERELCHYGGYISHYLCINIINNC